MNLTLGIPHLTAIIPKPVDNMTSYMPSKIKISEESKCNVN